MHDRLGGVKLTVKEVYKQEFGVVMEFLEA